MAIAQTASTTMTARKIHIPIRPPLGLSFAAYYSPPGLRASKRDGKREYCHGKRDGAERERPGIHAERAQPRDQPAAGGIRAAHRDDVDHVLRLVLLVAREHREEHFTRRVGD